MPSQSETWDKKLATLNKLDKLETIDTKLISILSEADIDIKEMILLISERELCVAFFKKMKILPEENRWLLAIKRTEYIYSLLKGRREMASKSTQSFIQGRKGVQIYNKFK